LPESLVARVTVYSTASCAFCERTKFMLDKWDIPYDEIRIDSDSAAMSEFQAVTDGARTVPQIVIDGKPIGGFDELTEMHMDGDLDELMQE
jgi:glutaredoxin 3